MFGSKVSYLKGDLQSNIEVSKFFSSSIGVLIGTSWSAVVAALSEFRGKAIFLPVLPGGSATAASDEDFNRSTVFFSSSIDFLIGSFCACFFFFFLTSSSEGADVEFFDSKLDDATFYFFFFFLGVISVSSSKSDDESNQSESKGSERFSFCASLFESIYVYEPFVNQFEGGPASILPHREVSL